MTTDTLVERLRCTDPLNDDAGKTVATVQAAAARIEALERELAEARRVHAGERERLRAMNDSAIHHLSRIYGLIQGEDIVTPDGRRMKFHPKDDLVRECWEALSKAIREIPAAIDAARGARATLTVCTGRDDD